MNTISGMPFAKIVLTKKEEPRKLKKGQLKGDTYQCPDCLKNLTRINYSHHNKSCSVKRWKANQLQDRIIYANGDKKIPSFTKKIELDPESEQFEIIPSDKERDVITAIGIAGSGKSFFINQFLEKWQAKHHNKDIYMFSAITDDPSIKVKLNRIDLQKFANDDDLCLEDFEDSAIVFDDVDCITDTKIRKKLYGLINYLLFVGRHIKCSILVTLHNPCDKSGSTKSILNESGLVVCFLNGMGSRSINYVFDAYLGMDKKQIKKLRNLSDNSRWVAVVKSFPYIICSQYEAYANYVSGNDD